MYEQHGLTGVLLAFLSTWEVRQGDQLTQGGPTGQPLPETTFVLVNSYFSSGMESCYI